MRKEFVMRGQTASSGEEVINLSGMTKGYGYRLVQFDIWPADSLDSTRYEMYASLTAERAAGDPVNPDFNNEGLIGTAMFHSFANPQYGTPSGLSLINDLFICTQNLRFSCREADSGAAVNWQMKFKSIKMNSSEEAVTNYKQFTISDAD
jgi:hypothetical protein